MTVRPALRLLSRLDRLRGRPDGWDDRRRALLRGARVPPGRLGDLHVPMAKGLLQLRDIEWRLMTGLLRPASLTARSFSVVPIGAHMSAINDRDLLRLELPAFGGVGSARAVATGYGELASGGQRLGLQPETLAAFEEPVHAMPGGARDLVLGFDLRFSMGYGKPSSEFVLGSSDRSYGFAGAGGSFGFAADPDLALGYGYVMNQMGFATPTDPREVALRRALYECLGGRPQS